MDVLCEYNANDALTARYIVGRGVDEPLRMERLIGENWRYFYYHTNLLGTVAALTEWDAGEETETIVERYTYDAYGRVGVQTPGADGEFGTSDDGFQPVSTVGNPYAFTARRLDSETGLMYFRARQYSTLFGRFINRDPLGYVDGMNLYAGYFVPNSTDPTGTDDQDKANWEREQQENRDQQDDVNRGEGEDVDHTGNDDNNNGQDDKEEGRDNDPEKRPGPPDGGAKGGTGGKGGKGSGSGGSKGGGKGSAGGSTGGGKGGDKGGGKGSDGGGKSGGGGTPPPQGGGEPGPGGPKSGKYLKPGVTDWTWKGGDNPPDSGKGNWVGPNGEKVYTGHDNSKHGEHWDYTDSSGNEYRLYPNGPPEPK